VTINIKVGNDVYPDDYVFEVIGLGAFTNGEERELSEDEERSFVSMYQMPVIERIGENANVSVSGSPTVENLDDVLGRNVSDTVAVEQPVNEEVEAPQEETVSPFKPAPTDEGGGT
jgi:hypothetical protein